MATKQVSRKIAVFTEDKEAEIFFRAILKRRSTDLEFLDCTLGCDNLIELVRKKIPGFRFPESLILLDGDVKVDSSKMRRISGMKKSILILPGSISPERLIAEFLFNLSEASPIWDKIHVGYTKQYAFKDFSFNEILNNREKAKEWFNQQKTYWGKVCVNVINQWIAQNQIEVNTFLEEYDKTILGYKKLLPL